MTWHCAHVLPAYAPPKVHRFHALHKAIAPARTSRLLATALAHSILLLAAPALAQTWSATPIGTDWDDPANWNLALVPNAPTAVAEFGATNGTFISLDSDIALGTLRLTADAPAGYRFDITSNLSLVGTGIENLSAGRPELRLMGGVLSFDGSATAANAFIQNLQGRTTFNNSASAGSAYIITGGSGSTEFYGDATGGNATVVTESDGVFSISGLTSGRLTTGSIAGGGDYHLGSNNLQTGSLGLNSSVGGIVSGTGGSLTKVGTGTLTLSGINTYSGGTTLNAGTLAISTDANLGASDGSLSFDGGTLEFLAGVTTARDVTLATGGGTIQNNAGVTMSGDMDGTGSLTKTGTGTLVLTGSNSYSGGTIVSAGRVQGDSNSLQGDIVAANGTTIVFDQNTNGIYAGDMTGSGALIKQGTGTLTVTGTFDRASITNSGYGTLNVNGGTLELDGGSIANSGRIVLGTRSGENGTLRVTGNSARIETSGASATITVGSGGTGRLLIENGGSIAATSGSVGANGAGEMIVDGSGSTWTGTGQLSIGNAGAGMLSITNGGQVNSTAGTIGQSSRSTGEVLVSGAGSRWTATAVLTVGYQGRGTLSILDGGQVSSTGAYIGHMNRGEVLVSGAGSQWSSTSMRVGFSGDGRLSILDGGQVTSTGGNIGTFGTGEVLISGAGSRWTSTSAVIVGDPNARTLTSGTITVADGGTFASPTIDLTTPNGTATLNIGTGGAAGIVDVAAINGMSNRSFLNLNHTDAAYRLDARLLDQLQVNHIGSGTTVLTGENTYRGGTNIQAGTLAISSDSNLGSASGLLNFGGGTLRTDAGGASGRNVTLNSGGGTIDTNGSDWLFSGVIDGVGSLNKTGVGTLALSGTNTYSGGTAVREGTVSISADANLGDGAGGIAFDGGTLHLSAEIVSARTVTLGTGGGTIETNTNTPGSAFSGVISGDGSLTKTGSGTLTLSGTNIFTGGTTLRDGTLAIGADANLGASAGSLTFDGGTLEFLAGLSTARDVTLDAGGGTIQNSVNVTMSGNIDGTGALSKTSSGTLVLTGINTYSGGTTVSAGRLQGDSNSLQGDISTANGTTIAFNQNTDGIYAGDMTGSAALIKQGAGTLTLNGTSSYSGGTTISGGTLRGNSASLQGDIVNNAATIFDQASNGTYSGTMSGSGSLTKVGTSTLTLSGANTYAGGTNVAAGALRGDSTSLQGRIVNNASVVFDQATAGSYAGVMSGSGSLTKSGAGTLTLNGTNSYAGGTRLEAGTLSISADHNLGAAAGTLTFDGGTLQTTSTFSTTRAATLEAGGGGFDVASGSMLTYDGAVDGSGELRKFGAGTLILNGANNYSGGTSVLAGTLRGDTTSLRGNISNDATLVFDQQTDGTFHSVISGTGGLTKLGTGALTFRGANTYSGPTLIERGLLSVNGSLMSAVTVRSNASLSGTGTIHNRVMVERGATLAPGSSATSIGALTIDGPLTLSPGSRLVIDADAAGNSDRVRVVGTNGTAAIEGSTLRMDTTGNRYQRNTTYTVLTADAGVSGAFAAISSNLVFLTPSLSYETNAVRVTLTRNDLQFSDIARGENQLAVAEYLDGVLGIDELIRGFDSLSADQARHAFGTISGEGLSSLPRASAASTARAHELISTRLAIGAEDTAAFTPAARAKAGAATEQLMAGGWARAIGASGKMADGEEASGYNWDTIGTAVGFERMFGSQRLVGASVMHTRSEVSFGADRRATGKITTPQALVYSSYTIAERPDRWRRHSRRVQLRSILGYARHEYETERPVDVGLFSAEALGSHDAQEWSAQGEIEFVENLGDFRLQTLFGLRYIRQQAAGYTETGGSAALTVSEATLESVAVTAGGRLVRPVFEDRALIEMRALWSRELNDTEPVLTASLADASGDARFSVAGVPIFPDTFTLGASISAQVRERVFVHADYKAELWRTGRDQHSIIAGFSYLW